MKIKLESTSHIVTFVVNGADVQARIWQGETEDGVPVQCFITRIAPEIDKHDVRQASARRFGVSITSAAAPAPVNSPRSMTGRARADTCAKRSRCTSKP